MKLGPSGGGGASETDVGESCPCQTLPESPSHLSFVGMASGSYTPSKVTVCNLYRLEEIIDNNINSWFEIFWKRFAWL